MATLAAAAVGVRHPLEPLTVDEIAATVAILRRERDLGPRVRFVNITLHEPPKDVVLAFEATGSGEREAFVILGHPRAPSTEHAHDVGFGAEAPLQLVGNLAW